MTLRLAGISHLGILHLGLGGKNDILAGEKGEGALGTSSKK
jgi:hypothetical protein